MFLDTIKQKFGLKLSILEKAASANGLELEQLSQLRALLSKQFFDVAFIGEFTAGKSSIINALLNLDILPTRLDATTTRITYLSYSENPSINIIYKNKEVKAFPFDEKFIKNLIVNNQNEIQQIHKIEIFLKHDLLKDGIRLIDTPGTNDTDEERVNITYGLLPEVDAVCYVNIHPITESNLNVFRRHILGNNIQNVILILNKMDLKLNDTELVIQDTIDQFKKLTESNIENFFAISTSDYSEGKEDDDFELIRKSNFLSFQDGLVNFLQSGERYKNLEVQYSAKIKKIAFEIENLLEIKIAGLSMPEDIFEERKKNLESELKEYIENAKQLSQETDTEINQLTNKLDTSLDTLLEEILEAVDSTISNSDGSTDLVIKQIEQGVKNKYDLWKDKNEPVIKQYIQTITEEVRIRLGKVVGNINLSIERYTGKITALQNNNTAVGSLLSSDKKAQATISIASAGTYAVMAMLHVSMAPLAIVLAPIAFYLYNKKKAQDRNEVKPKIINDIQQSNSTFRREALREVYQVKKNLITEIDTTITNFSQNIKKQIANVDRERNEMKGSLDAQIEAVGNNLNLIKKSFPNE